jgi:hypothetical protein
MIASASAVGEFDPRHLDRTLMMRDHHVDELTIEGPGGPQRRGIHAHPHLIGIEAHAGMGSSCEGLAEEPLMDRLDRFDLTRLVGDDARRELLDLGVLRSALSRLGHLDRGLVMRFHPGEKRTVGGLGVA